eukprot:CAMPEP_0119293764 /NCGR_PEP_ID=MMETSP1329-20130426/46671_1 /TAXON_ID=114041 /ORGANISM="Genus nov. species nov., Strain RCC1024" /LENGTH=412 /DNA_ID=CAMNT_0007294637 /DNA_START=30 /DNA_END=1264 /DNA_ORIENTATION=-
MATPPLPPYELLLDNTVVTYVRKLKLPYMVDNGEVNGHPYDGPWEAEAIPGGNLNFAWKCYHGPKTVFVKQAPPYIRCLGEGFPLTPKRIHIEAAALKELRKVAPARAPDVLHFDAERHIMICEDLSPPLVQSRLLRDDLRRGFADEVVAIEIGDLLGALFDSTAGKDPPAALAEDNNAAMVGITRDYVFTKPWDAEDETNRKLEGALALRVAALRRDGGVLAAAQKAVQMWDTKRECLCHGDLHSGSVMVGCRDGSSVAIDAEFACIGPAGFDAGLAFAGYIFAYATAGAWVGADTHRDAATRLVKHPSIVAQNGPEYPDAAVRRELCRAAIKGLWEAYVRARELQKGAASGTFEDAGIFCACELFRRVVGAASVPELSDIEDAAVREAAELLIVEFAAATLVEPPTDVDA